MITKEIFVDFINKYYTFSKGIRRFEKALLGKEYSDIWESDWIEAVGFMFDIFLYSHFTEAGCDLISDYVIANWRGSIYGVDDEEVADIQTLDDLWNYMVDNSEDYFNG